MTTYTVTTEKMVTGGDCLAKIDGKAVLIPYALPEETLEIEITKDFRDYSLASVVQVLEPSEHRVLPFCPLYGKCGGCNMQHIDSAYQTELRKSILAEAFVREGLSIPEIGVIGGNNQGYRARFQLHDGGLMERKSNNIIDISNCPCATQEVNKYLSEVPMQDRPKGRVHIFGSDKITSIPNGYDKIIVADESEVLRKKAEKERRDRNAKSRDKKRCKQKTAKTRFEGTSVNTQNLCTVELNGKSIHFDVQGFFQSNLQVLEKVIPSITEGLSGTNVLDMYAGAGTFSVFLTDLFNTVCLVEHNKGALVFAEQNLAGKKHESYGVSGETWVNHHAETWQKQFGPFDAAVVDPPRSGMEKKVSDYLGKSGIPKIRCVSCDAATQARDIARLTACGYKLEKLFLLDFYPQTCHIESLAWLTI